MTNLICRKPRFAFALFVLFLGLAMVTPGILPAQEWARKMFKEYSHDFGNVPKGQVPEFRFEIQNVFEEDIHIAQAFSSCGCTSVSLSKNILKTWEKGEVICRFNSPAFDGAKKATITVRFDSPFVGEVQLEISGNIVRGFNFTPNSIDFGQVTDNNLPEKKIQLDNTGSPTFKIVDVKSTFPHIKVQLRETARNPTLVSYQMTTQLKPTVPGGFSQGELFVVVEENNIRREVPIKFSAKVVSTLQMPESISMGGVENGESVKKKIVLKSERPFRITDVTSHNAAFRVKADREVKKVHFVEVIYTGEGDPRVHESELSFYVDSSTQPAGKVKAVVEVVRKPPISETAKAGQ